MTSLLNFMKKVLLIIFATCLSVSIFAQDAEPIPSPWTCSGVLGLNASATGLVNWSAGGNNNINGVAFGKLRVLYNQGDLSWETNLNLAHGCLLGREMNVNQCLTEHEALEHVCIGIGGVYVLEAEALKASAVAFEHSLICRGNEVHLCVGYGVAVLIVFKARSDIIHGSNLICGKVRNGH